MRSDSVAIPNGQCISGGDNQHGHHSETETPTPCQPEAANGPESACNQQPKKRWLHARHGIIPRKRTPPAAGGTLWKLHCCARAKMKRTFSLRGLLIALTLIGVALGIYFGPWAEHRRQLMRLDTVVTELYKTKLNWSFGPDFGAGHESYRRLVITGDQVSFELAESVVNAQLIDDVVLWARFADGRTQQIWSDHFSDTDRFHPGTKWTRKGQTVQRP